MKEFATTLPHRIADLTSMVAIRTTRPGGDGYVDFHVRAGKVRTALKWLQENNHWYHDVIVSEENLALLPDDGNVFQEIQHYAACEPQEDAEADDSSSQVD